MSERLTVLFFTKRFNSRMEKSTEYLIAELAKRVNLLIWEEDGSLPAILSSLSAKPNYILLNDFKFDYSPRIAGLAASPVPVGAILHEINHKPYRRKQFYERENILHLFTHYRDASMKVLPELQDRFIWFPHHVPHDIFKDYGEERVIDVLMMGILLKGLYPQRTAFYNQLKSLPGFIYHEHPGYGPLSGQTPRYVGNAYARELARSKIFVTCDSKEKLPLMKYFEALACKTLLVATASSELEDLGFVDGETFVAADEQTIVDKVNHYLAHEKEREKIVEQGYQLILKRHTTVKRTERLMEIFQGETSG